MYCVSFAGDSIGGADSSMWIWSGYTPPRTITTVGFEMAE
jgi:hypothetical protein